jgi:hypothetical protein
MGSRGRWGAGGRWDHVVDGEQVGDLPTCMQDQIAWISCIQNVRVEIIEAIFLAKYGKTRVKMYGMTEVSVQKNGKMCVANQGDGWQSW